MELSCMLIRVQFAGNVHMNIQLANNRSVNMMTWDTRVEVMFCSVRCFIALANFTECLFERPPKILFSQFYVYWDDGLCKKLNRRSCSIPPPVSPFDLYVCYCPPI
jgi:hypothetical protein